MHFMHKLLFRLLDITMCSNHSIKKKVKGLSKKEESNRDTNPRPLNRIRKLYDYNQLEVFQSPQWKSFPCVVHFFPNNDSHKWVLVTILLHQYLPKIKIKKKKKGCSTSFIKLESCYRNIDISNIIIILEPKTWLNHNLCLSS